MGTSLHAQKLAAWANHQVEKEGIAKLTIIILLLTTVGMLSFTWGYAEGVHNSHDELAEEIRLPAPAGAGSADPMPSIAQLRHNAEAVQQQGPPPGAGIHADSSTLPVGVQDAAAAGSNATGSLITDQQLPQLPEGISGIPSEQQQPSSTAEDGSSGSSSTSGGSTVGSDSSTAADTGGSSDSSSRTSMSGDVLQTHSRADDGSEDSIIKLAELESTDDDYHG